MIPSRFASWVSAFADQTGRHHARSRIRLSSIALLILAIICGWSLCSAASGATLPDGFTASQLATGLSAPTAMAFAPDGRLFVCEQAGALRVIKDGRLLPAPFVSVNVSPGGERGLLGVAFDPAFPTNHYLYIYYTAPTPSIHNRVSRLTADGDVALAGSEVPLLELNDLGSGLVHNGGALRFGLDGKLYIGVGENAVPSNSQSLATLLGKILRINSDGSIPPDNPFYQTASGNNRAIWAYGLRNPFTFAIQPGTGRIFINDVGEDTWEEIDDGIAGSNYGWPETEGFTSDPRFRSPIFEYGHGQGDTLGCAITGGVFYNPPVNQFPVAYTGTYFFADFCNGWIRRLDPANGNLVTGFATGLNQPVDLQLGPDGGLYYLARGDGAVFEVRYTGANTPAIITPPADLLIPVGAPATFAVTAAGGQPLAYQWQRNGVNIPGATSPAYTIPAAGLSDNGALFQCVVSNSFGSVTSRSATLSVTSDRPPVGIITSPVENTLYQGGDTITYAGTGTDPEDGDLPASAFTWEVRFQHDTHFHPFILPTTGAKSGSFTIPTTGETSANVWYRIILTVTDAGGLSHTSFRDVLPRKSVLTLDTSPPGLQVTLDGQPHTTPFSVEGVAGIRRTLGVVSPQTVGGATYEYNSWFFGGAPMHDIVTPLTSTAYIAIFTVQGDLPPQTFQLGTPVYFVPKEDNSMSMLVYRVGDVSGAASVDYATSDGTSSEKSDYTAIAGTLHFAPGETSKGLALLLTHNAYVEGNRIVNVTLSNPTGGAGLGYLSSTLVMIVDNSKSPAPTNPADDAQFFVRQHYHDFLNREPDQAGLDYWTGQLAQCGSDAACIRSRRIGISAAFFVEQEFQKTGGFVYRLYQSSLGTEPTYAQFTFDRGNLVGGAGLQDNQIALVNDWINRPAFTAKYPASMNGPDFVAALLRTAQQATGLDLSAQQPALLSAYNSGGRALVLLDLVGNSDLMQAEYNPAFVLMQYFGYLRRDPDPAGYQFWLGVLNNRLPNDATGYRSMVCAFITSFEYQERFNFVITHNNGECGP